MSNPICTICGGSGAGVVFNIFNPVIPPFGTACVACEEEVVESLAFIGTDVSPADCDITESGEVWAGLTLIVPAKGVTL